MLGINGSQSASVMFCIGYTLTLLEGSLEGLHKGIIGIVDFHEVARNFLEVLYEVFLVVLLCEVGILYLLVHKNLLHSKSLHKVVSKLPP